MGRSSRRREPAWMRRDGEFTYRTVGSLTYHGRCAMFPQQRAGPARMFLSWNWLCGRHWRPRSVPPAYSLPTCPIPTRRPTGATSSPRPPRLSWAASFPWWRPWPGCSPCSTRCGAKPTPAGSCAWRRSPRSRPTARRGSSPCSTRWSTRGTQPRTCPWARCTCSAPVTPPCACSIRCARIWGARWATTPVRMATSARATAAASRWTGRSPTRRARARAVWMNWRR